MTERDSAIRRKIFKQELDRLKEKKYINEQDFNRIKYAYNLYLQDLDKDEQSRGIEDFAKKPEPTQTLEITQQQPDQTPESIQMQELIQKLKSTQKQISFQEDHEKPVYHEKHEEHKKTIPVMVKTPKSADQTRERNITWALILGVILLFIGGLVFGTSNWSSMNNLFKVVLVSLVSIVFFAISFIADKYFKINKTAFAFMTLGSLFLPISIISIGFFELLGHWLSMYGEGKYVLGFIGSIICLPLYSYIAAKYKQRLFVWFSYLTATIGVAFFLALSYLPSDFFYLGMMIYNALLLFGYYKLKNNQRLEFFTKELPVYAQLNLIVSTLLMLFFFENEIFYSFNILLTAVLYISMVFVNKSKHYHFIFTLLFVYGMYQLIENSILQSLDYIGFALIGMMYLIFQQYPGKENDMGKIFRLSSGMISFCAFIFISIQGLLLRSDEDSIVLLLAYLIIAINYICLSNMAKQTIFRYLAPIFLLAAGFQSYFVLFNGFDGNGVELYMFAMAVIMYAVLYLRNHFKYFSVIKTSSFVVSIGTMSLTIFSALVRGELSHASILFLAFGLIALITYKHTANENLSKISVWANPVSWGLSLITIFDYFDSYFVFYRNQVEIIGHLAIGGLLLLGISFFWKSRKQTSLDVNTFLTGVALYTLSMLSTPLEGYEHPVMSSSIYFVGIAVYILLVYKIKQNVLWIFVSITSLVFLLSLTNTLNLERNQTWLALYSLLISLILLAVYEFIGRKIQALKPYFFWTAHVYLVPAFLFSIFYLLYAHLHPALLLTVLAAYIYSTLRQTKEWEIKLFLYAAFTTLPVILYLNLMYYREEENLTLDYLFLIVTGIISVIWLLVNETWKRRIDWYLIPQAVIGLLIFIGFVNDESIIHLGLFVLYTIFALYLMNRRKWQIYMFIPLFLAAVFFMKYLPFIEKPMQIGLILIVFFVHHLFGHYSFKELFTNKNNHLEIDWYTITSSVYILMLFVTISIRDPLWMKLIPSLLVVYFLFMLINRFTGVFEKRIVKTLAAGSILLPYYTTLWEFDLNQYIETELYVLPFIVVTIFFSRYTWKDYKKVMNMMQMIVLLIVTFILVSDALRSNTIYDAIIIGVLSLASIISGMQYRIKSYFFVGIAVLLLNVLLQTRPFWGNFPWWGYLSIAGLTLISFAGFNELQKQKQDSGKKSFLQTKKEQFIQKFKDWD